MNDYNRLNEFYKNKFGERVLKISIDGGFTCPNRDGKKSFGGCVFCSEKGSGTNLKSSLDISNQVKEFLDYKKDRANKFIVYFQNFTSTYGNLDVLKEKYDASLIDDRIIGLDIDTRADEINEDVCKLLSSYKEKYYVLVELGLQTINENTHRFINQHISNEDFENALFLLNKYNIDVVVHIMVGLPNENHDDIVKNTKLALMYEKGEYIPLSEEDYINEVIYILTHIRKDIVIHRITGDPAKEELIAPTFTLHKKRVLNSISKIFKEKNLRQGCYFGGGE